MSFSEAKFIPSKSIVLNLIKSVYERKYVFSLASTILDKGETISEFLEKEIAIELLKDPNPTNIYCVNTDIKKLTLDPIKIKQENFKQRLQELVSKLTIATDETGSIISINNHDTILKQWEQIKKAALATFKGAMVEKYLQGLEEKINNEQKLIEDIKQSRLLGFLFSGLYKDYSSPIQKQKTHLQAVNYFPVIVNETYTWVEKNENDKIHIKMEGLINEIEMPTKKINTFFQRKGYSKGQLELTEYEGNYKIDSETGWINQADFKMTLKYGADYLKSQTISIKQL
ncbi:MAG: hypothetical protein JKY08_05505 [Flavobacteriaceae bacterium]|nr:hypothetical protein [Flavobacteriaceae bacterium]